MILQRYILRELAWPVFLSTLFFSFVMLMRHFFATAELLLEARVGWDVILELAWIVLLTLTIITVPMAALLGTLIGIGRLTADNEILAMRVGGITLGRVFYPVFLVALVVSGLLMFMGFEVLPRLATRLYEKEVQISFEMLTRLEPGRNYDNLAPRGTEFALFFEKTGKPRPGDPPYTLRMEHVALRVAGETDRLTGAAVGKDQEQETIFFAREGVIVGDLATKSVRLQLTDGVVLPLNRMVYETGTDRALYRENPARMVELKFASLEKAFAPRRRDERSEAMDPHTLTLERLLSLTAREPEGPMTGARGRLTPEWRTYLSARNELYQRFALPLSVLSFVLIAVPLAVELRPRSKTVSFLLAMGLIVFYYVLITWAGALGMTNSPFAFALFMAPNVLLSAVGLLLFWKVQR